MGSGGTFPTELSRIATNPSRAIYGTIVATAVIAASPEGEPAARIAGAVTVTLVVFWLAHVYAAVLEHRFEGNEFRMRVIPAVMAEELPMIEAAVLGIALLLVGAFGWISQELAVWLALVAGVVQLLLWGLVGARRLGWSWPATILAGAVDAAFGLLIISLKAIVH